MQNKIWEQIEQKLPSDETPQHDERRKQQWRCIDMNNNGYLSLAQVDKGLRDIIKLPAVFNLKPVIIRAFNAAKKKLKATNPHGDDYVSKAEYKYLVLYLKQYYTYWQLFDAVDTSDDRRINLQEFKAAIPTLAKWGVKIENPQTSFNQIDKNKGGFILFDEFCEWAISKHLEIHH